MPNGFLGATLALSTFIPTFAAQQRAPAPPAAATLQQQLQAKFAELHKAGTFPGGTAGFVLADGSSFGIAVGVSDRTAGTPMKPTNRLLLGSVGKTYAVNLGRPF
jgi:CubicO group peptidase (beta-lactamase class C family)